MIPNTPDEAPDPPPAITTAHVAQLDEIASVGQVRSRPANTPGYYRVRAPGVGYSTSIEDTD